MGMTSLFPTELNMSVGPSDRENDTAAVRRSTVPRGFGHSSPRTLARISEELSKRASRRRVASWAKPCLLP